MLEEIREKINSYISKVESEKSVEKHIKSMLFSLETEKSELENKIDLAAKAIVVLQKLVKLKEEQTLVRIEELVSTGLQRVFGDTTYKFNIISRVSRNQIGYSFTISNSENEEGYNILDGRGGGVANIVSLLLRVIVYLMIDPKGLRFIILDEAFNNVSPKYHEPLVTLIQELSNTLNFQILLVTHQPIELGDTKYELKRENGVTTIEQVRN